MKKLLALVLALAMVLGMTGAMADGADDVYTGDSKTTVSTSDNTITMVKSIVMFNTDGSSVREPNIKYIYTLTPVTGLSSVTVTGKDKNDTSKTATATVKDGVANGVTGCTIEFKDTNTKVAASKDGVEVEKTGNLQAVFTHNGSATFPSAGIYRYKITETAEPATITTVGLDARNSEYDTTRYLDVYIGNKADGSGLELVGAVIFKTSTTNKDGKDSITTTTSKTTGYEPASGATDYKFEHDTDVDKYHTFNLTVNKTIAGSLADKTNDFPFEIGITGTNSTAIKADYSLTGSTYEGTAPATDGGVSISTTQATLKPKMSDGDSITITGLPTGSSVTVKETNNTSDTYTPSITTSTGLTAAPTLTFEETSATTIASGKYAITSSASISDKTQNTVIGLTNTIAEISPTGYVARFAPYALILVAGVALLIVAMKKRKNTDEE